MRIIAHDENSLTNLFFSEVFRLNRVEEFLRLIHWRKHVSLPFSVKEVTVHQQLSLSEFGRPDVTIVVLDHHDRLHVVIVEGKLASYIEAAGHNLQDGRFNKDVNSCINNQLSLRYRAWRSLESLTTQAFLTEIGHSPDSPYATDHVRRCKKLATCRILKDVAAQFDDFYLVALTTDRTLSPGLADATHKLFPLFFHQREARREDFPNIGSVSWYDVSSLFDGLENHFVESRSIVLETLSEEATAGDHAGADIFVKGRQIIHYENRICHLSCKGYSYAIRFIDGDHFIELDRGKGDRDKYLSLRNHIRVLGPAPEKPITDLVFWRDYFTTA